jgi:hypothetical protein
MLVNKKIAIKSTNSVVVKVKIPRKFVLIIPEFDIKLLVRVGSREQGVVFIINENNDKENYIYIVLKKPLP